MRQRNALLLSIVVLFSILAFSVDKDVTKVVYMRGGEVYTFVPGKGTAQLTRDGTPKSNPVWSQNGKKIAYRRSVSSAQALANVIVVDEQGAVERDILFRPSTVSYPGELRTVTGLQWINEHLLVLSGTINPTTTETVVLNLDSAAEGRTDFDDLLGPSFSKDGTAVAYISGSPHFAPISEAEPALNLGLMLASPKTPEDVLNRQVFPKQGTQVTFLSNQDWSDDGKVAVLAQDNATKNKSVVIVDSSKVVKRIPVDSVSVNRVNLMWDKDDLFLYTSDDNVDSCTVAPPSSVSAMTTVAPSPSGSTWVLRKHNHSIVAVNCSQTPPYKITKKWKALRAAAGIDNTVEADFWCEECILSILPRKSPINIYDSTELPDTTEQGPQTQ